jgi:hypothetical protein
MSIDSAPADGSPESGPSAPAVVSVPALPSWPWRRAAPLRVFGSGQYHGRFMMTPKPGSRPSLQARLVAVTLAGQAGRALAAGAPAASTG